MGSTCASRLLPALRSPGEPNPRPVKRKNGTGCLFGSAAGTFFGAAETAESGVESRVSGREQKETGVLALRRAGDSAAQWARAKHQLAKRLTLQFLRQTPDAFNRGNLDPDTTAQLLSVSRTHLFRLRAAWLQQPATFTLHLSGGNHRTAWSAEV